MRMGGGGVEEGRSMGGDGEIGKRGRWEGMERRKSEGGDDGSAIGRRIAGTRYGCSRRRKKDSPRIEKEHLKRPERTRARARRRKYDS